MVEKWSSDYKASVLCSFVQISEKRFIATNISHTLVHTLLFCNIGESSF